MDQYPDENEEFELQYQDELELLEDLPDEFNEAPAPSTSKQKENRAPTLRDVSRLGDSTLGSPQLSQITFGASQLGAEDAEAGTSTGGLVNRRLFGTPKGPPMGRGCSTPFQRMPAIQELESTQLTSRGFAQEHENPAANQLQEVGLKNVNKRRLERDLFGDIDDLFHESYEDPMVKKARTEEQRDHEAIDKILELRRKMRESSKTLRKDDVSRLKALHDFKMRNLSYDIPNWPFLAIQRSDLERIYVRFHSEDYEQRQLDMISARGEVVGSLLGEAKEKIWQEASEIVLSRLEAEKEADVTLVSTDSNTQPDRLWVDKYKPRKYIDLLSDEMTNRSLLYWLKMWDKVVFGKAFHSKQEQEAVSGEGGTAGGGASNQLNSFNKRTGKFESNGGWRQRKSRQALNTNVDALGRPVQKVALLCGPPGLGKTTLAHTIARHAGYNVREINASDDRSPEAFKLALENGTQMSSVLNEDKRPNCIVLDEIDGAPRQSIDYLVKFISDGIYTKVKAKGAKAEHNVLKRPIICICNDVYDPALRPLRQVAFVVTFPPIDAARLAERLVKIAHKEQLKTDFGSLIALAEKSGNDVRSCISSMQFFNAQKHSLTLQDVLNNNLGQKDRHQGLFAVWDAIFRIQRPRKTLQTDANKMDEPGQVTMTNMSVTTRVRNVLDVVHSSGDYERLTQGVYENYLQQKMPDPNFTGVCEALQWFCFTDMVQHQISRQQNYSVYPYLQYGFVVWHLLFATLAWPKIAFPTRGFELQQKSTNQRNIFQAMCKGVTTSALGVGQGKTLLLDTVPLLKRILSPQLRSVAVQLLSKKEQQDLRHTIEVMVDLGLTFVQVKSQEGHYVFQTEPDLDALSAFPGFSGLSLPYFSRQLIAREVDLERIRRAAPKGGAPSAPSAGKKKATAAAAQLPNHLQTLKPKPISAPNVHSAPKQQLTKDFFGRITHKSNSKSAAEDAKTDAIVKSPIWYRYKEGFNNAVRKDVHIHELL
ncbi:chromosome transmission fidelity protein 18 homolog [Drosophila biarmipes]|uniref:chromosome transmission fidelity protein 18 homolog n=1 Tax=Drosophila biarmipes TaxID=125945 RepID=UPI0007E840FC|nr:chromosome transmission fidelity protein 18 homolog [Drosophila biarmipes]